MSQANTSSLSQTLNLDDFFSTGIKLLFLNSIISNIFTIFSSLYSYVINRIFFSISIESKDDAFQWVLEWLSETSSEARNISLKTKRKKRMVNSFNQEIEDTERPEPYYVPGFGTHFRVYRGRLLWVTRVKDSQVNPAAYGETGFLFSYPEVITLSVLSFGNAILKELLKEAMELSFAKIEGKTCIFTVSQYFQWKKSFFKSVRSLESVVLDKGLKEKIISDIQTFRESSDWYKDRGIPWRRGYLLYGPPGTGKTSFILALAATLKFSVCIASVSGTGMTDANLLNLINNVPPNAICLLEDVDHAFRATNPSAGSNPVALNSPSNSSLTFSGFLNAVDGICSGGEGRILFMTTNHLDRLAPSLIRPGRVDLKMKFDYASKYQVGKLAENFFPDEKEVINKLVDDIPDKELSPAELQGFFMVNRFSPKSIPGLLDEFLKEIKEERRLEKIHRKKYLGESDESEDDNKNDVNKNDVNKNDVNKNDVNKSDVNKSDVNKSDVNKSDVNKSDVNKNDVNKNDVNKNDVNKNDVNKNDDVNKSDNHTNEDPKAERDGDKQTQQK